MPSSITPTDLSSKFIHTKYQIRVSDAQFLWRVFLYISKFFGYFYVKKEIFIFFQQVTGMAGILHIKPKVKVPITIGNTAFDDSFGFN